MNKPRQMLAIPIGGNRTVVLNEKKAWAIVANKDIIRSFMLGVAISEDEPGVWVEHRYAEPLLTLRVSFGIDYTFGKRRAKAFIENIETIRQFVENIDSAKAEKEE